LSQFPDSNRGPTHWASPNAGATNETGFTALPGGYRDLDGFFDNIGFYGSWWSSTEGDTNYASYRYLSYNYGSLGGYLDDKEVGFSVRCVRD